MLISIENIIMIIALFILSVEDIKRKSLGAAELLVLSVAAGAYRLLNWEVAPGGFLTGLFFLSCMLALSILTKSIGVGDVIVLGIIMILKGVVFAVNTFLLGITLLFTVVLVKLILRKITKKSTVPFVPYLGIGMIGVMICG